ncbi:MAG: peptidase, partial [Candidatus Aminicenantaceae bacterium]
MKFKKSILILAVLFIMFMFLAIFGLEKETSREVSTNSCTDIIVGKDASVDGSVITSHTGCCPECRVHVVPAKTFKKGDMAPVYYGLQDVKKPLHE